MLVGGTIGTTRSGGLGLLMVVLQALTIHVYQCTATLQCPSNTTVSSSGQVVGAGTLNKMAAQSAEICCSHCADDAACAFGSAATTRCEQRAMRVFPLQTHHAVTGAGAVAR